MGQRPWAEALPSALCLSYHRAPMGLGQRRCFTHCGAQTTPTLTEVSRSTPRKIFTTRLTRTATIPSDVTTAAAATLRYHLLATVSGREKRSTCLKATTALLLSPPLFSTRPATSTAPPLDLIHPILGTSLS